MRAKKKTILLVSDTEEELKVLENLFGQLNTDISIVRSRNGKEALSVLMGSSRVSTEIHSRNNSHVPPDAILLQENLQDMAGLEFINIIRKYYSLDNIKIMLIGNTVNDLSIAQCENLGIVGRLRFPLESDPHALENLQQLFSKPKTNQLFSLVAFLPSIGAKSQVDRNATKKTFPQRADAVSALKYSFGAKIAAVLLTGLVIIKTTVYGSHSRVVMPNPGPITEQSPAEQILPIVPTVVYENKVAVSKAVRKKVSGKRDRDSIALAPPLDTMSSDQAKTPTVLLKQKEFKIKVTKCADTSNLVKLNSGF